MTQVTSAQNWKKANIASASPPPRAISFRFAGPEMDGAPTAMKRSPGTPLRSRASARGGYELLAYSNRRSQQMELHVTGELEAKLTHSAAKQGRNPDELVQDLLTRYF